MIVNRRTFLRRSISSALGGAALYGALGNLKVMAAAANLNKGVIPNDYRALVCVFLHGGNDQPGKGHRQQQARVDLLHAAPSEGRPSRSATFCTSSRVEKGLVM